MNPSMLNTRAAAATVAFGLGVALASGPTAIASADSSSEGNVSSTGAASTGGGGRAKADAVQSKSTGSPKKPQSGPVKSKPRGSTVTPTTSMISSPLPTPPVMSRAIARVAADVTSVLSSLAIPATKTVDNPANWLLAAAARRELGDTTDAAARSARLEVAAVRTPSFGTVGRRIDAVIVTLLAPVRTLLAEFGVVPGSREEQFPGSCVDSVCVSSSDIPVPQPQVQTTFLNVTGRSLTLTAISTNDPLAFGPQVNYVLENGRQVEMGFYKNQDEDTPSRATMTWSDGSTQVSVYVNFQGATATPSNSNLQTDVFTNPTPITGPSTAEVSQTVLFLPKAGSEITIDATDGVGQAIVATALCENRGSCTLEAVGQQVVETLPKSVGNTVFNYGSETSSNSYEVGHEVVKTSGVEENLKIAVGGSVKFTLGPINFETEINAVIQQKYGHTWSSSVLTRKSATVNIPPGSYGQIQLSYNEYHDFVDMTLTDKNVTINIPGLEYVSPVPVGGVDASGNPIAGPTWITVDYPIGTGPDPTPNSTSTPVPPTTTKTTVPAPTPHDIAAPVSTPAAQRSLGSVLRKFVRDETRAILSLPEVLSTGQPRQLSTRGFEVVNLTPYPQKLISITGEIEEDDSPASGYVLQPFQMVRIEVDYASYGNQEAYVTWQRNDGGATTQSTATLKNYKDGSSAVQCGNSACMDGGEDEPNSAEVMYIIQPSPTTFDLTTDVNLASAAVDAACYYTSSGATPGSCSADVTGQSYYTQQVGLPYDQNYNPGTQVNAFTYTIITSESETESWSAGGGLKIKEKSNLFVGQQIEVEATALYTGSVQEKASETTTVKQNLAPQTTGTASYGDAFLRTYGDFTIFLPNSTTLVRNQWIENPSGLAAMGPVVSLDDYPGAPRT
ncbi:hypothetical protein EV580_4306 [Mycobacterium sp. BK086]|nr:hypothetical protein EV580_4306 [Mycobacterium sp. BK086]